MVSPDKSRRPSSHVAEHVDRAADVVAARIGDRLAVVERFDLGELVSVLFKKVAEVPYEPRTLGGRDARPRAGFERLARRLHRKVDVGFVAGRDVGDDFLRRRILDLEGLAALGLDPFAVDQHVMLLGQKRLRIFAKFRFGDGDVHDVLPMELVGLELVGIAISQRIYRCAACVQRAPPSSHGGESEVRRSRAKSWRCRLHRPQRIRVWCGLGRCRVGAKKQNFGRPRGRAHRRWRLL